MRLFDQELYLEAGRRAEVGRKAQEQLAKPLEDIYKRLNIYNFKHRCKSAADIIKKVERKRREYDAAAPHQRHHLRECYNPADVEDPWGCRFVTLLQPETVEVLEEILAFVIGAAAQSLRLGIKEIIVYSSRPHTDPLNMERQVQQVVQEAKTQFPAIFGDLFCRPPRNPESGYSSLHVIMTLPITVDVGDGPRNVEGSIEVQIRDVYEDGWGELSHRQGYKRLGATDVARASLYLAGTRAIQLNALKAAADAVSQQATLLDRSLTYYVDAAGVTGTQQSVSNIASDQMRILDVVPQALRGPVSDAYRMMQAAHDASVSQIDNDVPCGFYGVAAQRFQDVITRLPEPVQQTRLAVPNGMPVAYYLTLEYANARVRSCSEQARLDRTAQTEQTLAEAIARYEALRDDPQSDGEYGRDATIHLRLGQAQLIKARTPPERDAAIETLSLAQKLAREDRQITELGADHWLPLQAYYEISKARLLNALERGGYGGSEFKAALDYADKAVARAEEYVVRNSAHANIAHKIINNALYFRVERAHAIGHFASDEDEARIKELFHTLRHRPFKRYVVTHTETIDTLLRAALQLKQQGLAYEFASRNAGNLRQIARARAGDESIVDIAAHLNAEQREMYTFAMGITNPYARY